MPVTDSTSALIYKDHGQIMKGDMGREVETAAQSSGYRTYRYSMLWGKTLTHIAQACRRLVAELTTSNPECEIDIVCWWLGNEICGDYGCLPPIEAMGTAWLPSTLNSVEYVTARIRNGIQVAITSIKSFCISSAVCRFFKATGQSNAAQPPAPLNRKP